jgi:hypothetical protein
MALSMARGKRQILFDFLPGRTFDFERVATIARVTEVRGTPRTDVNPQLLLRRVAEAAGAWDPAFRPGLTDQALADAGRFVFLDPTEVRSELYPRVFWCQNRACGRVVDATNSTHALPTRCSACRSRLAQVRWVRVHRCGTIEPLRPPSCPNCHNASRIFFDTRGSERISEFIWGCRQCRWTQKVIDRVGNCPSCTWPNPDFRRMRIDVHRAGTTFYAQRTVVVNVPHRDYDVLLATPGWWAFAAARFLGVPPFDVRRLADLPRQSAADPADQRANVSNRELSELLRQFEAGLMDPAVAMARLREAQQAGAAAAAQATPQAVASQVVEASGVGASVWEESAQELLEYVAPHETGRPRDLSDPTIDDATRTTAASLGLAGIDLIADYPILTAVFGFSRSEYAPNECYLLPFAGGREHGGRFPIFVDEVQADALLLRLDPARVLRWMVANHRAPTLPGGTNPAVAARGYFAQVFSGMRTNQTLSGVTQAEARMVFGLLHTFSHLAIRHAALLCGLDRTSLSEYMLPRTLTAGIYCNHRFGATIGALTALFEQSMAEWLGQIASERRCAYDPVCSATTGSCHACSHLAETSCRAFNLNLNRAFLFGGTDPQLGEIPVGYLDPSLG